MPPRVRKTAAGTGALRRSPRLAERKRRRDEAALRQAKAAEAALLTVIKTAPDEPASKIAPDELPASKTAPDDLPASLGPCLAADARPAADYLQGLLPGGLFFGHAAVAEDDETSDNSTTLWSVRRERALLRAHWDADRGRLLRQHRRLADPRGPAGPYGPRLLDAELALWAVLQHRFRCGLDDLFRYGLRPDLDPAGTSASSAPSAQAAASATTRYCRKLTTLLAHPLWTPADLAAARWLLQRAVQARVSEERQASSGDAGEEQDKDAAHPAPIVPPYAYSRPPFVDTAREWASAADRRRRGTADAAAAAAAAEAELTWFLFAANAPRDLWMLDWLLDNPGAGTAPRGRMSTAVVQYDSDEDSDDDSDDDTTTDDETTAATHPPRVRTTICAGGLGSVDAHAYADSEVALRFTRRQQADRHAAASAAPGPPPDSRPDDRVLFLLQERDLDRLLGLLASPDFLEHTGFAPPAMYSAAYAHMHAAYYGSPRTAAAPPICNLCLLDFYDGDGDGDGDGDCDSDGPGPLDDDDDNHDHHHDHNNNPASPHTPDHVHYFHQAQVCDVPPQHAAAWLLQRKGAWLLAARREEAIWRERQQLKTAGGAGGSDVPDIPPFDPSPQAHLDRVFSGPSQLGALMGCRRIGRAHAAERWCFAFGGQD